MKNTIFYLLLILFFTSCEKENFVKFPNAGQRILFQVEYINHAWGFDHRGIVIDSSGNVGYFKFPESWHSPDTASWISGSEMNDNLTQLDTVCCTLDKNTVLKYFSMLENVSEGQLSKPYNTMFDAGETTYSGYLYDSNTNKYKHVLVKRVGDWSIDNYSPEAEDVYTWLLNTQIDVMKKLN
jgi:hypothetical protein